MPSKQFEKKTSIDMIFGEAAIQIQGRQDISGLTEGPDILLSPEQAEAMLQQIQEEKEGDREKRHVIAHPQSTWKLPVLYKFDANMGGYKNIFCQSTLK